MGTAGIDGLGAILAGPANVVMQLSRPEVGRGVVESRVESGQLTRHPAKRFRTTFTYLAVALLGTDSERSAFRREVDAVHAHVHSGPDSPLPYDAFDPSLQKWVAACLYRGALDVARALGCEPPSHGDLSRLATTLQVRPEDWPPDREAFEDYWDKAVTRLAMDSEVASYLWDLVGLRFLPYAPPGAARLNRLLTGGFLPEPFRDLMGMSWSSADQSTFDRLLRLIALTRTPLPSAVRAQPLPAFLWDLRRRRLLGLPLV